MHRMILVLAFLSGVCGLAYEVLYARLLSNHLGDQFYVTAALLSCFLVSLGIGAIFAERFPKALGGVEISIGLVAIALSSLIAFYPLFILQTITPIVGTHPFLTIFTVMACVFVPACLIGFSVPLFTLYLNAYAVKRDSASAFTSIYQFYNLGAALCVLAIEYGIMRSFGIYKTFWIVACVNIIIGLIILRITPPVQISPITAKVPKIVKKGLLLLFVVGVASGLFQVFFLKIINLVFGPYHENFALTLALALIGITVGAWYANRRQITFRDYLSHAALILSIAFVMVKPWIYFWAELNDFFTPAATWATKIYAVFLFGLLPFSVLGAAIPIFIRDYSDNFKTCQQFPTGLVLGVASFGNCFGFLLMPLVLHTVIADALIASCIVFMLASCGLYAVFASQHKYLYPLSVISICSILPALFWPTQLLTFSNDGLANARSIAQLESTITTVTSYRTLNTSVDILQFKNRNKFLNINGYLSLALTPVGNIAEIIFGVMPALFSKRRQHALVLGLGTGITGAATASLYKHTQIVEINPLVITMLDEFSAYNMELSADQPNVQILHEDGLTTLARTQQKYDAIINTVPTPLFFSASKLYTVDFFKLAASKLAPGGIYALWFDARVSLKGAKIIFQTLQQSFADCAVVVLKGTYFQLICANEKLQARPLTAAIWPAMLKEKWLSNQLPTPINRFLMALIFPHHNLLRTDWQQLPHRLDLPVLEFAMATGSSDFSFAKMLQLIALDLRRSPQSENNLNIDEWAFRCFAMSLLNGTNGRLCLSKLRTYNKGIIPQSFIDLALTNFKDKPAFQDILLDVSTQLIEDQNLQQVWPVFAAMEQWSNHAIEPAFIVKWQHLKVKALFARDGDVDDRELGRLFMLTPMAPAVRTLLIAIAHKRKMPALAQQHKDFLKRYAQ